MTSLMRWCPRRASRWQPPAATMATMLYLASATPASTNLSAETCRSNAFL
jgi:hypothetical protein